MLRAVIFDLDNTLVNSDLDFARIKAEIGTDQSILEYRASADEAERQRIDEILERHERRAAATCELCDGAHELLAYLVSRDIRTALLTRNSRKSVDTVLARHGLHFDCVVSREDAAPKPSPEPVLLICKSLGVSPHEALVVGDFLYDTQAGQAAGTMTLLLDGPHRDRFEANADYEAASLHEALRIIRKSCERGG